MKKYDPAQSNPHLFEAMALIVVCAYYFLGVSAGNWILLYCFAQYSVAWMFGTPGRLYRSRMRQIDECE